MKPSKMPRHALGSLLTLNEGPWRWAIGVQAGIAMGLPIALFTLGGHQSFGFIASLGAFTALYGAKLSRSGRLRILPLALIGLIAASSLGVLASPHEWLTNLTLVTVAALGCVLTLGTPLGPPGPIMFVLVAAVSAQLAAPLNHGGAGFEKMAVPALVALGGLIAYLVIISPLALPSVRRRELAASDTPDEATPGKARFDSTAKAITIRVVIAVAIASFFNRPLGAYRSYWVIVTAVAVLQSSPTRRLTNVRAFQRVIGTILGVGIFAVIAMSQPAAAALVAIVVVLQFAVEVVVARNYGLALLFITPLALTIYMAGRTVDPFVMIRGRISDTLLGASIALAVFWSGEWLRHRLKAAKGKIDG